MFTVGFSGTQSSLKKTRSIDSVRVCLWEGERERAGRNSFERINSLSVMLANKTSLGRFQQGGKQESWAFQSWVQRQSPGKILYFFFRSQSSILWPSTDHTRPPTSKMLMCFSQSQWPQAPWLWNISSQKYLYRSLTKHLGATAFTNIPDTASSGHLLIPSTSKHR